MKYVFYFILLVLNQILLIDFLNSYCYSLNNHYQFNQSYTKRKHFKKHHLGFKFEEKNRFNDHFILHKNKLKRKRKFNKDNLSTRLTNKNSIQKYNNGYGKKKHRKNRTKNKKVIDEDKLGNDSIDESNKNYNSLYKLNKNVDNFDDDNSDFFVNPDSDQNKNQNNFKVANNKNHQIILLANFSLINSERARYLLDEDKSKVNRLETDNKFKDKLEEGNNYNDDLESNHLVNKKPVNLFNHSPNTLIPPLNIDEQETKNKYKNLKNRRRVLDKDNELKETSLSLLNYLGLGLILFLIVLQLMLLLCPTQRKLIKKKLKSKWRKYKDKRSSKRTKDKKSNKKLISSNESSESTAMSNRTSSELIPLKGRRKQLAHYENRYEQKAKNRLADNQYSNNNNRNADYYEGNENKLNNQQEEEDFKWGSSRLGKQLNKNKSNNRIDKRNLKNNKNDKFEFEKQLDEDSSDNIEINLNNEPTLDRQEEIKLKMSKKQDNKKLINNNENSRSPRTKSIDKMKKHIKDDYNLKVKHSINKVKDTSNEPKVDLEMEAKLIPKLKWYEDNEEKSAQEDKDNGEKSAQEVDNNEDKKYSQNKNKTSIDQNLKDSIAKEPKRAKDASSKEKENIEQIPVNWLTIIGNKRVYKENIGVFERGDKVNILRLKPPNFDDLK